jgi:ADP-ribose pyrophosphatase YjhB (NUDIX family)
VQGLAAGYHAECVSERVFPDDRSESRMGPEDQARLFEAFLESYEGALEGGAHFRIRTLAPIESGWVHVEWVERERRRATGEIVEFVGYSHFLIEAGRIRRQRTVRHAAQEDVGSDERAGSSRRYPARPVVGVGAVVLVDGRVLLVKRRFEPLAGQWSLPGGALEVGETLAAGVAREVLEETGLQVEVGPVVEVFDRILLDEDRRVRYHFVLVDYLCRPAGGDLSAGSDVAEVALVPPEALQGYYLTPKALSVIQQAVAMAAASSHA